MLIVINMYSGKEDGGRDAPAPFLVSVLFSGREPCWCQTLEEVHEVLKRETARATFDKTRQIALEDQETR